MDPVPLQLPPGTVKLEGKIAATGRFIDCDHVRWVRGLPEKIGGWTRSTDEAVSGTARGMFGWSDGTARSLIAIGTEKKLYALPSNTFELIDITPFRITSSLTDPFTTVSGSSEIAVAFTSHGAVEGQGIFIDGPVTFNGVTLDGAYLVSSVGGVNEFSFDCGTNASASGSGGGTIDVSIEIDEGVSSPSSGFGYGVGGYGMGTYGTPRATSTVTFEVRQWSLAAFGKILLSCYNGGAIFDWDPTVIPEVRAEQITATAGTAPTQCSGLFITAERILIAFGTNASGTRDLLEVFTCAQGDYLDWDYTATSGSLGSPSTLSRLSKGTKVVAGADLGGRIALLWTDTALYSKQYTGSRLVFTTSLLGEDCGLIGPMAFVVHNGVAYWAAKDAFFQYRNGLAKIPNSDDIAEWVFRQIRPSFGVKTFAWVNPRYSEIWFHFVVGSNDEPTIYAVFNYEGQFWFHGTAERTSHARIGGSKPYMASTGGYIFEHETGLDAEGDDGVSAELAWHIEHAPVELRNSGAWAEVFRIEMDMQRQVGDIDITISAYEGTPANATVLASEVVTAGPDDSSVYPRLSGQQVAMRMEGAGIGCDFRLGVPRVEIQQGSQR